jgi:hypothetical protein
MGTLLSARILAATISLCHLTVAARGSSAASEEPAPRTSVVFVEPDKFTDVGYFEGERGSRAILLQLQRFIV